MHRQRTKLSDRMNRVFTHRADRVAKAIERQGIRATYELHDRLLSNRSSRDRFDEAPPELDELQQGILSEVREHGFAVRPFHDLFPDGERWRALEEQRDRFVASTETDLAAGGEHVRVRPGKEFVVRLQSYGVELGPDDPWFGAPLIWHGLRAQGDRAERARAHHGLARAHLSQGQQDLAREHADSALRLYSELRVPDTDDVRALLDISGLPSRRHVI